MPCGPLAPGGDRPPRRACPDGQPIQSVALPSEIVPGERGHAVPLPLVTGGYLPPSEKYTELKDSPPVGLRM